MDTSQIPQARDLILATIPSTVILVDGLNVVTEWNRAAERNFGISASDAIGRALDDVSVDWDRQRLAEGIQCALSKRDAHRLDAIRFTRADGKSGVLGMTLIPLKAGPGGTTGCILLGAETTERKRMESQLVHAQKMESIGQLAAGIAHEINTPIQYVGDNIRFLQEAIGNLLKIIDGYVTFVEESDPRDVTAGGITKLQARVEELDLTYLQQEIPRAIEQSLQGVDHVANIVRAMKQFSHPDGQDKTSADLNAAISSTVTVSKNEWKYLAEVELDLDPTLAPVPCLLGEFNQTILNIIVNATHAIAKKSADGGPQKGTITVSTRQQGVWVEIRISDTGTGIPEQIRNKVFDPFFTTKEVGKGTGQGLSLAYSTIVEKHGGTIHFETGDDQGTTFIIRLPLTERESRQ